MLRWNRIQWFWHHPYTLLFESYTVLAHSEIAQELMRFRVLYRFNANGDTVTTTSTITCAAARLWSISVPSTQPQNTHTNTSFAGSTRTVLLAPLAGPVSSKKKPQCIWRCQTIARNQWKYSMLRITMGLRQFVDKLGVAYAEKESA